MTGAAADGAPDEHPTLVVAPHVVAPLVVSPPVVAIDGPAAAGKGTLARRIAEHFGLAYLDTGSLYRVTAFLVLEVGGDPADPAAAEAAARRIHSGVFHSEISRSGLPGSGTPSAGLINPGLIGDARLRGESVARAASVVAAHAGVRRALLSFQRDFAAHPPSAGGAVLDGRDIGTVVCPHAAVKLFVTASVDARAQRRCEELRERGMPAIYVVVLQDMKERDARDSGRRDAPLAVAPDAIVIDTTMLDPDQVFERATEIIARSLAAPR